jgi:hypothetical protein
MMLTNKNESNKSFRYERDSLLNINYPISIRILYASGAVCFMALRKVVSDLRDRLTRPRCRYGRNHDRNNYF